MHPPKIIALNRVQVQVGCHNTASLHVPQTTLDNELSVLLNACDMIYRYRVPHCRPEQSHWRWVTRTRTPRIGTCYDTGTHISQPQDTQSNSRTTTKMCENIGNHTHSHIALASAGKTIWETLRIDSDLGFEHGKRLKPDIYHGHTWQHTVTKKNLPTTDASTQSRRHLPTQTPSHTSTRPH